MQIHRHFLALVIICFPLFLSGQNLLSLSGGISNSHLPIYTQENNTRLLSSQALYKLTFDFSFQHRLNQHLYAALGISYKNIGINTLNQQLDRTELILNSVSRQYLTLSYIPKGKIQFGKLTIAGGIGASIGYAIHDKIENYLLIDRLTEFLDTEDINLKKLDAGVVLQCELKRIIGDGLYLFLLVEQYQGLINTSLNNESTNKIYMSNSALRIGLQFPLSRK